MQQEKRISEQPQPELYSYSRVSTNEQLRGSGKQQQKESLRLEELSKKFGLPVSDRVFEDDGKSAFHGKNLDGALGAFIAAVDSGEVAKGSILAVFSLDRISRQNIIDAQTLFMSLLRKGIKVYTAIDDKLYGGDPASYFTDLIMSMVYLERANNESVHKSERTRRSAQSKIKRHMDGERGPNGYALSIESVGNHVWWVMTDPETNEVVPRPRYFDVAKDICSKLQSGWGTPRILTYLGEKVDQGIYPKPLPRANRTIDSWGYSLIANFTSTGALFGDRVLKVDGEEFTLKNYYPPIITEDEYHLLKAEQKTRVPGVRKNTVKVNFVSGIKIAYCRMCGGPVGSFVTKHGTVSYRCLGKMQGRKNKKGDVCPGWAFSGANFEEALLKRCRQAFSRAESERPSRSAISLLSAKLDEINFQRNNLIQLAKMTGDLSRITLEINSLSEQEKDVTEQIRKESAGLYVKPEGLEDRWDRLTLDALDTENVEARTEVRELMRLSVERIDIQPVNPRNKRKRKFIAIVYFRNSEHSFRILFESSVANACFHMKKGEGREEAIAEYYSKLGKPIPEGLKG